MSRPIEAAPDFRAADSEDGDLKLQDGAKVFAGAEQIAPSEGELPFDIEGVDDGDTLVYDAGEGKFLAEAPSGGGATPKVYRATLTQSGTDAPVANILENTLGGIPVWLRLGTGDYLMTLAGAFPLNKTVIETQQISSQNVVMPFRVTIGTSPNSLELYCNDGDSLIEGSAISILVYP